MPLPLSARLRRGAPVLLVAALALAGCGAADDAEASSDPSGEAAAASDTMPAAEGTTAYPLTVETWAGPSVVEERPERVAAIGFSTNLDVLEAIDVVPVYFVTEDDEWEWRDPAYLEQIEFTDTATRRDETNVEAIAATRPDVIIALNYIFDEAEFERLSAIAPVVEYAEQQGDQADWRAGQRLVGEVLDLAAAADTAITEADEQIAAVAAAHPEFDGRTATIGTDYGPEYGFEYYTPTGGTAETVMTDLGFTPNPTAEQFVADPVISDENVALLDADVLVVIYQDEATRVAREEQQLFQAIPAVAEGRYVSLAYDEAGETLVTPEGTEVSNATWVLRRGASALSLPWAVDVITEQWLADVDLG